MIDFNGKPIYFLPKKRKTKFLFLKTQVKNLRGNQKNREQPCAQKKKIIYFSSFLSFFPSFIFWGGKKNLLSAVAIKT
jgi:hypothetical protein